MPGCSTAATAPRVAGSLLDLGLQHTQAAGAVELRLRRILRERIAALDDPQPDHPMKRRPVVGPLARQLDEVADMIRREIGPQVDDERPRPWC